MGDEPLTNAVVEYKLMLCDAMNSRLEAPAPDQHPFTDDFVFEDRRTGGISMGRLDGPGFAQVVSHNWGLGEQRPQYSIVEVVAVRGQRSAAAIERTDYGNWATEYVSCTQLDPTLTLQHRYIIFDVDDRDAAIAELDRLHAEIDD
jgi:hypothetical protein